MSSSWYNIAFSADGYSGAGAGDPFGAVARAKCLSIGWGLEVIANEDESRTRRAFYPRNWSTHSFTTMLEFTKHADLEAFSNWMRAYADKAANPDGNVGRMRVIYPVRNFDFVGVLMGGIRWGNTVGEIVYQAAYNFVGAQATAETNLPGFDTTAQVQNQTADNAYFYPTGVTDAAWIQATLENQLFGRIVSQDISAIIGSLGSLF